MAKWLAESDRARPSRFESHRRLLKRIALAVLLGLAIVVLGVSCLAASVELAQKDGGWFVDWQTYALAWDRVASGASLFAPAQLQGEYSLPNVVRLGYAYPPSSVVLFAPVSMWPAGFIAWTTINAGAFLTALWAIASRCWPSRRVEAYIVMLFGLSIFRPFTEGVGVGNVSILTAGVFGWTWVIGRSAAAPLGGLVAIFKVLPGSLVALAVRSHPRRVALTAAGVLVFIVSPSRSRASRLGSTT
jgi:hypothetical protein